MINNDRYAYSNALAEIHPMEKFSFALITMVICLISSSGILPCIVLSLMTFVILFIVKIPPKYFLHLMLLPVSFLLLGVVTIAFSVNKSSNGFIYHVEFLGYFIGSQERDLFLAGNLFIKSLGAVACLYFLSLSTPMIEIISVLRKLKVPPLFVELMSLMYRFIFVLMETAAVIRTSQSSRLGYENMKNALRSLSRLFSNLFIRALHRSQVLSVALTSRCYSGELKVLEKKYPVSRRNIIIISVIELWLLLINFYLRGDFLG